MRIALGIEYDGSLFYGWQSQNNLSTIQQTLEIALSKIANHPIKIFCAGRTDKGVHATSQVIHFDTTSIRNSHAWIIGTNANLPPTIRIKWCHEVEISFHARFSATARCYRYVIHNASTPSALLYKRVTWFKENLNAKKMHEALQFILGENDFSSFRSSQCESKTPMRYVMHANAICHGSFIVMEIKANAFLHHMIRNIVGVAILIGLNKKEPAWMQWVLNQKNRCEAAQTATPDGLYLVAVDYPVQYNLPQEQAAIFNFF